MHKIRQTQNLNIIDVIRVNMFPTILECAAPLLMRLIEKIMSEDKHTSISRKDEEELGKMLTGRLVYLLRYMDIHDDAVYPKAFGRVLASFTEIDNPRQSPIYEVEAEQAWAKASQYACAYLSLLGLVEICGGLAGEVIISPLGRTVLQSGVVKNMFKNCFLQPLPR